MTMILHITPQSDWRTALEQGAYTANSLTTEGFIHCSTSQQVAKTANFFFKDVPDLVLLHINTDKLAADLKWEAADGDTFPHIYGPLNLEAVEHVETFAPNTEGLFIYPQEGNMNTDELGFYKGTVPQSYISEHFILRPLTPEFAEMDFEALEASRNMFKDWGDGMATTLEDNRADLAWHEEEFNTRSSYSYTVLNPSEDRVEGCLYLYPLYPVAQRREEEGLSKVQPGDVYASFWIREDRLADEALLFNILLDWLKTKWQFHRVYWGTNNNNQRQNQLFEKAGMALTLSWKADETTHQLYQMV